MEPEKTHARKRLSPLKILGILLGIVLLAIVFCYMLRILATELL